MSRIDPKNDPTLRPIRYGEWISPEYAMLMGSVYREEATRRLQSAVRQYRQKKGKKVSAPTGDAVTNSGSILRVVYEPIDDKYKEHVEKIKANAFAQLDFADTQFERNLYKCLRLGEITLNQMFLALQLYQAKAWLVAQTERERDKAGALRVFQYQNKDGPYQPQQTVTGMTPEREQRFHQTLTAPEDQQYF